MKINSITIESIFIKVRHGKNVKYANCICECGNKFESFLGHVKDGHTKSCGCRRISAAKKLFTTHGHSIGKKLGSTYKVWRSMKKRCEIPSDTAYSKYGAVGIKICKRWNKFENFLKDMGERPSLNHSIDRINNNSNYTPQNCRWATTKEQSRNRTHNIWIEYKGERLILADWALKLKIGAATINYRLKAGWPIEDVLFKPLRIW